MGRKSRTWHRARRRPDAARPQAPCPHGPAVFLMPDPTQVQEVGDAPDEAYLVGEAVHDGPRPRPSSIPHPSTRCSDSIRSRRQTVRRSQTPVQRRVPVHLTPRHVGAASWPHRRLPPTVSRRELLLRGRPMRRPTCRAGGGLKVIAPIYTCTVSRKAYGKWERRHKCLTS